MGASQHGGGLGPWFAGVPWETGILGGTQCLGELGVWVCWCHLGLQELTEAGVGQAWGLWESVRCLVPWKLPEAAKAFCGSWIQQTPGQAVGLGQQEFAGSPATWELPWATRAFWGHWSEQVLRGARAWVCRSPLGATEGYGSH